jgi:hypothetical protein
LKTLSLVAAAITLLYGQQNPSKFRIWVFSDAHAASDLRGSSWNRSDAVASAPDGRESLATALRQSEDPATGFPWDIALDLGDLSGAYPPSYASVAPIPASFHSESLRSCCRGR